MRCEAQRDQARTRSARWRQAICRAARLRARRGPRRAPGSNRRDAAAAPRRGRALRAPGARARHDGAGQSRRRARKRTRSRNGFNTLTGERDDLVAAIAKLRHGIQTLNREGRERLLAAFEQVNEHFSKLFVRLFGGGQAFLRLDNEEGEDPLEAGLEIMASPPGKKLQALSLLSGGEQALTALALLFAVFLTNPAPICILDEVDAPLDDANVDRFCRLVEEIAETCETRFLIITHHRLTMARVDRLFGVTMSEKGVSQLVSVDLQAAERIRRTA